MNRFHSLQIQLLSFSNSLNSPYPRMPLQTPLSYPFIAEEWGQVPAATSPPSNNKVTRVKTASIVVPICLGIKEILTENQQGKAAEWMKKFD